jgi:cyclase
MGDPMRKSGALPALLLLAATAAPALAEGHHDRGPQDLFRLVPLRGGVYALYGRGGTVGFFVGEDAVAVVDSQFKDIAPGIITEIRKVTDKPIKYLLNTHHHVDHVGGNPSFVPFSLIIAHDNVRKRMLSAPADVLRDYPAELEKARKAGDENAAKFYAEQIAWAKSVKIEEIAAPLLTFDSELRIHLGGETVQAWHTPPAHTDGDCVVYFEKARVVHMGDLFWNKVVPFIDVAGGGSVLGYLNALDRVLARVPPDVQVIAGHGEVSDVAGVQAFRKYVADVVAVAEKAKRAGVSKEKFLEGADLPEYKGYSGYADRFKDNCSSAYDEVR